jgi:hypothetical protein
MRARLLFCETLDKETGAILIRQIAEEKLQICFTLRHLATDEH